MPWLTLHTITKIKFGIRLKYIFIKKFTFVIHLYIFQRMLKLHFISILNRCFIGILAQ